MITKLTSIKTVIAKIIGDLDLKEDDIRISDVRSWCGEAIEKIGAITSLFQKYLVKMVPITKLCGHQASLPCDLHQLHQVAYSFNCDGPWVSYERKLQVHLLFGDMTNVVAIVVVMMNLANTKGMPS